MQPLRKVFLRMIAAMLVVLPSCLAQQSSPMPPDHMHHAMQPVEPLFPRMGRSQEQAQGKLFTLDDAQRIASESNPTLRQAEAQIRAAKARTQQAGLYPNPSLGYTGDEIRGGSNNGGKQGFFVAQPIVTGGKLAKSRSVFEQETRIAELEAEQQKTRVETSVKIAFYRALAAQELLEFRRDLSQIGVSYQKSQEERAQTGQVDESEKLDTEIEVQRLHLAAFEQENVLREAWRRLAVLIGQPDLSQSVVGGDLEQGWPQLDEQQILTTIANLSPATRIADAESSRASAEITRARSQVIPDVDLLGGLEYNNEPLGAPSHAAGWEGLAELSVQLPIFNRNQGNIAAAGAELDRAQLEKQRIQLLLRERAATLLDQYATSKVVATEYRDEILPRAKKANALMTEKYGQMLAAYPRMLQTQSRHFELQAAYIQILETLWTTSLALQGFLLTDGLEAPSRLPDLMPSVAPTTGMPAAILPAKEMALP
jgi:outer membrane protein, heavy metal efflux system